MLIYCYINGVCMCGYVSQSKCKIVIVCMLALICIMSLSISGRTRPGSS